MATSNVYPPCQLATTMWVLLPILNMFSGQQPLQTVPTDQPYAAPAADAEEEPHPQQPSDPRIRRDPPRSPSLAPSVDPPSSDVPTSPDNSHSGDGYNPMEPPTRRQGARIDDGANITYMVNSHLTYNTAADNDGLAVAQDYCYENPAGYLDLTSSPDLDPSPRPIRSKRCASGPMGSRKRRC